MWIGQNLAARRTIVRYLTPRERCDILLAAAEAKRDGRRQQKEEAASAAATDALVERMFDSFLASETLAGWTRTRTERNATGDGETVWGTELINGATNEREGALEFSAKTPDDAVCWNLLLLDRRDRVVRSLEGSDDAGAFVSGRTKLVNIGMSDELFAKLQEANRARDAV